MTGSDHDSTRALGSADSDKQAQRYVSGPRRRAREMALQMLYQHDLAGGSLEPILRAFDLALVDYARESKPREVSEREGEAPELGAAPAPGDADEEAAPRAVVDIDSERRAYRYAREVVQGTHEHLEEIDRVIAAQAENWRLERMPVVDRNILRLAVYELLHVTDVPKVVVVNEAIELAKRFGSDESAPFVNGLLDGILHGHELPGAMH